MKAQAERIDAAYQRVNPEMQPSADTLRAIYAAETDDLMRSSQPGSSSSQPMAGSPKRSHREAALSWSRLGGGGNLAVAFNPARHSIVVAGRPVQARPFA